MLNRQKRVSGITQGRKVHRYILGRFSIVKVTVKGHDT